MVHQNLLTKKNNQPEELTGYVLLCNNATFKHTNKNNYCLFFMVNKQEGISASDFEKLFQSLERKNRLVFTNNITQGFIAIYTQIKEISKK